jgi:hypothetical protein
MSRKWFEKAAVSFMTCHFAFDSHILTQSQKIKMFFKMEKRKKTRFVITSKCDIV